MDHNAIMQSTCQPCIVHTVCIVFCSLGYFHDHKSLTEWAPITHVFVSLHSKCCQETPNTKLTQFKSINELRIGSKTVHVHNCSTLLSVHHQNPGHWTPCLNGYACLISGTDKIPFSRTEKKNYFSKDKEFFCYNGTPFLQISRSGYWKENLETPSRQIKEVH